MRKDKKKDLAEFYARQNQQIDEYADVERVLRGEISGGENAAEETARQNKGVKAAIYGSFILNVLLFALKIAAVALSGSISAIASLIDSFLDLLSGSIIFITAWVMRGNKRTIYLYPAGNSRAEPIGIIIFASAMFVASFQIIIQAIQNVMDLVGRAGATTLKLDAWTLGIFTSTIVIKFLMWLYCSFFQKYSTSVHALALDHRTDVAFNLMALACYLIGYYLWSYADPMGGILMAFYLMYNWFMEGKEEVRKLSGQSAPPEFLSKITFLAWNAHPMIVAIDTCRAYHLANGYFVELDIVLPHDMPLREAHDIGQDLQDKIETLEDVERCFVHLDWENEHAPEHPRMGGEESESSKSKEEPPSTPVTTNSK